MGAEEGVEAEAEGGFWEDAGGGEGCYVEALRDVSRLVVGGGGDEGGGEGGGGGGRGGEGKGKGTHV